MLTFTLTLLQRLWTFLRTPLGARIAVTGLAALALFALLTGVHRHGVGQGVAQERAAQAEREKSARRAAERTAAKAAQIGQAVAARVEKQQAHERVITRTITERIPIYVSIETDRSVTVPGGFIRLLDDAAAGRVSAAAALAGGAAEAPSGIALSAVGASIADNYGACRENAAQLNGWLEWAAKVPQLYAPP